MQNILDSYLVSIGYSLDESSLIKVRSAMETAEHVISDHSYGISKTLLEAQGVIVGTFTSISAGILGVLEKTAMADQGYRLMGLRMLATTDQARKLDLVTKSLGADLASIIWDPELHSRALIMSEDIDRMTRALGPGFEAHMKGIRDFRFEFSRLGVAVEFVGMQFASDVFSKMFPNRDALQTIDQWVTTFEDKIPEIADKLSNYAVPILKETWIILKDLGEVAKGAGVAFQNIVGILSGDSSIQGTEASFEKFAIAMQHVSHGLETFLMLIAKAELAFVHFTSGVALAVGGKFNQAKEEFKSGLNALADHSKEDVSKYYENMLLPGMKAGLLGPDLKKFGETYKTQEQQQTESHAAAVAVDQAQANKPWVDRATDFAGLPTAKDSGIREPYGLPSSQSASDTPKRDYARGLLGYGIDSLMLKLFPGEAAAALNRVEQFARGTRGLEMLRQMASPWEAGGDTAHTDTSQAVVRPTSGDFISRLATEMSKIEGFGKPGAIPTRDNNPGDLITGNFSTKHGALGEDKGYAIFPDVETGVKAQIDLIEMYIRKGDSLKRLIEHWSPPNAPGNTPASTQSYIDQLAKKLQIDPEVPLKLLPGVPQAAMEDPSWMQHRQYDSPDLNPRYQAVSYSPQQASDALADAQRPSFQQPSVSHSQQTITIDVGGIKITEPGADAYQIQRAIKDAIREALEYQIQGQLVQISPQWS